jgi:hypothetical protein
MAPWEYMDESIIFGVRNPEANEIGFVSMMGLLGEHLAVAVYRGAQALYQLWDMEASEIPASPEQVLFTPSLQLCWLDREEIEKEDRARIKQLGLKFRGAQAWPEFRSYRPGFLPWFLDGDEARFLICVLEQALDVCPRYREDQTLLISSKRSAIEYMVRVSYQGDGGLIWEDRVIEVPPPPPVHIIGASDEAAMEKLGRLATQRVRAEVDFFWLPTPISGPGDRPVYPFLLLIMETRGGLIIGNEILATVTSLDNLWAAVPARVAHHLAEAGLRPQGINVTSPLLAELLRPMCETLRCRINKVRVMKAIDEAKSSLFHYLGVDEIDSEL